VEHSNEVSPISLAINRITAAAYKNGSRIKMEIETATIVREWQDELGVDYGEFEWRLTTLRDELANGIKVFGKRLPWYIWMRPSAVARMREIQKGLVDAREMVCHLYGESLILRSRRIKEFRAERSHA
jgi:hypothetical protein